MSSAQTELGKLITPFNGTPMGEGLDRVLNSPPPYYASTPTAINTNRRLLFLMSDGASNGALAPSSFIPALAANKIKAFTVAYGLKGSPK